MIAFPDHKFAEMVALFGSAMTKDARLCRAVLADLCGGDCRLEQAALVAAVSEGMGEIFAGASAPSARDCEEFRQRIVGNRGVTSDLAWWAITHWANALAITLPIPPNQEPPRASPPTPTDQRQALVRAPLPPKNVPSANPTGTGTSHSGRWILATGVIVAVVVALVEWSLLTTPNPGRVTSGPIVPAPPSEPSAVSPQPVIPLLPAREGTDAAPQTAPMPRVSVPAERTNPPPPPPPETAVRQAVLCGETISYDSADMTNGGGFLGVWADGAWNGRVCGGLIVKAEHADGTADVIYVYAPRGSQHATILHPSAQISDNTLSFQDSENGHFSFVRVGGMLSGRFVDARQRELSANFSRQ